MSESDKKIIILILTIVIWSFLVTIGKAPAVDLVRVLENLLVGFCTYHAALRDPKVS